MKNRMGETEWYFAIQETPEPHGQDGGPPLDTFSPCWMLNKAYHGRGYAYEASHAFQRLCEKLGMRREGLFLEFVSFVNNSDGTPRYENTYQYAVLKKEWR